MTVRDRREEVERLYTRARELQPAARVTFVQDASDDNPELRDEVLSLLERTQAAEGFFQKLSETMPSPSLSTDLAVPSEDLPVEQEIGHYRILGRIGSGGMGTVYRARDARLDRDVALKFLPAHLSASHDAEERLLVEARAAAALEHPNVCTVHEVGETDDGRPFIAMALYEGETLKDRLGQGPLSPEEAVGIAAQIARGLAAAHAHGIVHRDVKPGNVMLTAEGTVKLLDFGLARLADATLTRPGATPGTVAYMSPEQVRGDPLDRRSDLWSLGVVLYEMLAGVRPFRGGNDRALLQAILHEVPEPLRKHAPNTPESVQLVVNRLLGRKPDDRYGSAGELLADLEQAGFGFPAKAFAPRHWISGTAAVAAVLLAALLLRGDARVSPPPESEAAAPGIAVLPFEVRGEDLDIWREGMVDLLSTNLDGVAGLRAIDSRTVLARWREEARDTGAPDLERALQVARGTGARYAVIGNVVSSGSRMRLGAQIYSLQDESSLASLQVEGPPDQIFALVDRLSIDVLAAIWQRKEKPRGQVDLARITTSSLPALKAFLEGESHLRRAEFDGAIAAYERAIAIDSTFAFALYHLSEAYAWMDEVTLMEQASRRALRHSGRLPEREALLLRAGSEYHSPAHDTPTTVGLLQEATRRYPDDADAWYMLGEAYFHRGELILARQDQSERAFRKAVELDPGFVLPYTHIVNNAFLQRPDSARVAHLIDMYHRLAPNSDTDQENHIAFGLAFGDSIRRREALAALDTLPTRSPSLENLSSWFLDHPRFWAEREAFLASRPRNTPPGPLLTFQLFETYLSQGKVGAALATLEDPRMYPGVRAAGFYTIHTVGFPVPEPTLDRELALASTDDLSTNIQSLVVTFYAGAYAADKGRWTEHAAAAARLHRLADRHRAAGDSAASRFASGAASALTGQGLWRRGDARRALSLLMDAQRQATWSESHTRDALNDTIRWWIGELLLEMGRPQEAALYFESFWNDPLAADRLAGIYEQMGDRAKAREAYALVASAWKDADPELQLRARESRAAVQRLIRLIRE